MDSNTENDEGKAVEKPESLDVDGDTAPPPQVSSPAQDPRFERRWSKDAATQSSTAPPVVELQGDSEFEKERARANDLHDRLQRSMAELSNYRKRADAEREEMVKYANMVLVSEILPVLDDFDRALATIPPELQHFTWVYGIDLIRRHVQGILGRQGLAAIEAQGQSFDPNKHEAVSEETTSDAVPGTITADLQTGYTMHDRLLRPSLVRVAKAPDAESEAVVDMAGSDGSEVTDIVSDDQDGTGNGSRADGDEAASPEVVRGD